MDKIITRFPQGDVLIPPSKSIAHRALLAAALAKGKSVIRNAAYSEDIKATLGALAALGATVEKSDADTAVTGVKTPPKEAVIDCGESGTTLRFFIPVARALGVNTLFTGRGRLPSRPLSVYEKLFEGELVKKEGGIYLTPLNPLKGGEYLIEGGESSQYVSGLLFALAIGGNGGVIRFSTPLESRQYADMTVKVLERFGVSIKTDNESYYIDGGQSYTPADFTVEGDYSQAAFFLAAALLGRKLSVLGLERGSIQGDKKILEVIAQMGGRVSWEGEGVRVEAGELRAITFDARENPDLVPPVAALCALAKGESRIVNAGRLRIKESDRLAALAIELNKLGGRVREEPAGLTITGVERLKGGRADARGDHRVAMAVALAAIRADSPVTLSGAECVNKSFPNFWEKWEVSSM